MSRRQHINHRHDRLIDRIIADDRIALLIDNASEDEIIIHAFNNHFFVESVLVAEEHLRPPVNREDLLGCRPSLEVPVPHADFPVDSDGLYAMDAAGPDFFHRPSVGPTLAVRRGCQIIRPRKPKQHIFMTIRQREDLPDRVEGFVTAVDDRVRVEHFRFACFDPEVLKRYSSDIDKFTVQHGTISCRHLWSLHYDVNDAGQIHVYLKDLRLLPPEEIKYWRTYNVGCKTGLSEVTFARDIQGDWDRREPNEEVVDILRRWHASGVRWWRVAEPGLLEQVKTPLTDNRTEWAAAFVTLSRLIIEGLQNKAIRKRLADLEIPYDGHQSSLNMIDTLLTGADTTTAGSKIIGLRLVQRIRSKYSHAGGTDALELAKRAQREHGTYASHFKHICGIVLGELQLIEHAFDDHSVR